MTYDPNDPRLTAYALGELDESDRPAIQAQVAECAESRRVVEEVRDTARLLTQQLQKEPSPGLDREHRDAIEVQLVSPLRRNGSIRWIRLAVAACLVLTLGAMLYPAIRSMNR